MVDHKEPVKGETEPGAVKAGSDLATIVLAGFIVLAVMAFVAVATFGQFAIIAELKDPAFARGLITVLIALTVIGAILAVVLFALLGKVDANDRKVRVENAMSATAGLVGILGTIVGFYFAASTDTPSPPTLARVLVERIGADSVAVTAFVQGGLPPFRYQISELGVVGLSEDGWIVVRGSIGGADEVRILVTDSRNDATDAEAELPPAGAGNE